MSLVVPALNELGVSTAGPTARLLFNQESAGAATESDVISSLFGIAPLGTVTIGPGAVPGFSGLRDYESLTVENGAVLTPSPNQFLFVRARTKIFWDGTFLGDGVFAGVPNLIVFGSQTQSGGGGGGGGGNSGVGTAQRGQTGQFPGFGNGPAYTGGSAGAPGAGGAPEGVGGDGTMGTVGVVDPFFLATTLAFYPGVLAAIAGTAPGAPGVQGGNGGDGADVGGGHGAGGFGGAGGMGGQSATIVALAAPEIEIGPNALFHLQGLVGAAGSVGGVGGAAPGASAGGGGGGGGGGSGGQGGNAGALLAYFRAMLGTPLVAGVNVLVASRAGGPSSLGGLGGLGDGAGDAGAAGGLGATGPMGTIGFVVAEKILLLRRRK